MKTITILSATTSIALITTFIGCGAGSATSTPTTKSTTTHGKIDKLNPLSVNGKYYDTTNSNIYKIHPSSKESISKDALKVGMVVNVKSKQTGTTTNALEIDYNEVATAPISEVNIKSDGTGSLIAGGQSVTVDKSTKYYGDTTVPTIDSLSVNDWVEISGIVTNNVVKATMVKYLKNQPTFGELEGVVTNFNPTQQQFTINGLLVDYSSAKLEPQTLQLADKKVVELEGTYDTNQIMFATQIEIKEKSGIDNDNINESGSDENESKSAIDNDSINDQNGTEVDDGNETKSGVDNDNIDNQVEEKRS